jgi:hypothetical protein
MLSEVLAEDRRLVILLCLSEAAGHLNEDVLRQGMQRIGHQVDRTDVRAAIAFLCEHALVRIEKLPMASGELWVVRLLDAGAAVASGKHHPGVARPPLR